MALHVRTQLRKRVRQQLLGLPTTAERVLRGRRRNLAAGHLPTLLVYTEDEDIMLAAMGVRAIQDRMVMLAIEGRANGADEEALEDLLDVIAAEVEPRILVGDPGFDGLATQTLLVKSRTRILGDTGELLNGAIRLDFRVTYQTAEGVPTDVIPSI